MNPSGAWDVIVAGGGPAGAITAWHLASAGMKVAVVDASRFPRDKACGGGVQVRAEKWIPFEWRSVVRSEIRRADFSYKLTERFTRHYADPLVYCVLRTEFDKLLLDAARRAGAAVFEGVRVSAVEPGPESVTVKTAAGDLRARYAVGADGANSVVGRWLNERRNFFWQAAIYMELPTGPLRAQPPEDALRIDWASLPSGYAWLFPKDDYVNIGAGCPVPLAKSLRQYLRGFLAAEGLMDPGAVEDLKPSGHLLPTLTHRTIAAGNGLFLVGDAAGLVEPLTGEGICYACHSGALAAKALTECFNSAASATEAYTHSLKREIGFEIALARRLLSLAVAFPRAFYWVFRSSDEVWCTFCRVLRGEMTFEHLRNRILGPLKVLGSAIDSLVDWSERKRLMEYEPASVRIIGQ